MKLKIKGEFITLQQLLKATSVVQTGGMAKNIILDGYVLLNNTIETRRNKKIYKGDIVKVKIKELDIDEIIELE